MSRPKHALLPLGALAAGFGLASAALAQTAASNEPVKAESTLPVMRAKATAERAGKEDYQAVETRIGKGRQELRDIPQSITVVTEKLIDDRNLDTLKDVLKNTAGISFQAAEGGEEDIRLRGFSLQASGDIFIDGMRDPAFYERDTFNYDRLEVLRGSASMLFGRGSTGGAVNQASKQPRLINQNEVAVTLGTGDYLRAIGDFNLKTGEHSAARLNVMVTRADQSGNSLDKIGIAPSFRLGIGTADEVQIDLYHLDNNNGVNYGLPWLNPGVNGGDRLIHIDPKRYYGAVSDYSASSVSYGAVTHTHRFMDGGELRTSARAARYARDLRAAAIRFAGVALQPNRAAITADTISDATVLTRGSQNKVQNMSTKTLQSDYSGKLTLLGLKNEVTTGIDLAQEDFRNFALSVPAGVSLTKPTTTIGTPNDGASVDESRRIRTVNRTFDAQASGVYMQDLLTVAEGVKLLAGLRWDRFKGVFDAPAVGTTPTTQRARSDSLWSKRLGALYQPTPTQSYHVSWGTSFNTSGDTYQYDALGVNTPPEGSRNIEIGGKLDLLDGRFTTRVAIFRATKFNERNRDDTSVNPTNYILSGQRHTQGIELDLAGRITPAWEVFGSYAYIPVATIDRAAVVSGITLQGEAVGSRPGLTPRHSGTIWTTYKLSAAWRLGGGLNARSADTPQLAPTTYAPRFITADLLAEYTLDPLSFKFNITNIGNKRYAEMLYRGHYIPGKPRTFQTTISTKF